MTTHTAHTAIAPHGGQLINRFPDDATRAELRALAQRAARITIDDVALSDLELIATGAFSPLAGFMGQADYQRVVAEMRLASGLVWSLPITLRVPEEQAEQLREGQPVALHDQGGRLVGLLELRERFRGDVQAEAQQVYRTTEASHPGVARLYRQGPVLLGGDVWLLEPPASRFPSIAYTPAASRAAFAERGWKTVVGFQTRNPVHRAHEYIQKAALELVDGLFLHPLVGATKDDDLPADVRVRSYEVLLNGYYPANRTLLGVYPAAMRYAGPREAILHAIARQNYGCTHFIVGRDHAGVGSYYGTYDSQQIFDQLEPGALAITPLRFEHTFYCRTCTSIASPRTCPHDKQHHLSLSGTRVRELLRAGTPPPPEFTRPEVAQVLIDALRAG
jgi:sulfate adenylyltransferase